MSVAGLPKKRGIDLADESCASVSSGRLVEVYVRRYDAASFRTSAFAVSDVILYYIAAFDIVWCGTLI